MKSSSKTDAKIRRNYAFSHRTIENLEFLIQNKVIRSETEAIDLAVESFTTEYKTTKKLKEEISGKNPETINIPKHEMELINGVAKDFNFMTKEDVVVYAVRRLKEDKKREL